MLCEKCHKNPATVHMHQSINGSKIEVHLCSACAMPAEMPMSFENLFQGLLDSILSAQPTGKRTVEVPVSTCPTCGMTSDMFKSTGKLGCADCYRTFTHEINALLKNVQGSVRHEGKYPQRSGVTLRQKREIDRLRVQLSKAIEMENFEEAAALRDRIRAMEATVEV